MKTPPPETIPATFDFRLLPGGKDAAPGVDPRAVALLGGAALAVLRQHPGARRGHDTDRLAHLVWAAARWLVFDEQGRTVERALADAMRSGSLTCEAVLRVLLAAGDLKATLVEQRAALDKQIRALDGAAPAA